MSARHIGGHFPPPKSAARFYFGPVMHQRLSPAQHRFQYQVVALLIDLHRLEQANRLSPLFSVDRLNLVSFHQRDHGADDLAAAIGRTLEAAEVARPHRLLLLCYPRVIGYVFNPIATYFAYDAADRLLAVVQEVRNTFGDRHRYVAPVREGEMSAAGLRQSFDKQLYVSPFMPLNGSYRFSIRPPTEHDVALRILHALPAQPLLAATFHGTGKDVTSAACRRLAFALPWLTAKVILAIHAEAVRLWFKGLSFHRRPKAGPSVTLDGRPLSELDRAQPTDRRP